MSTEFRTLELSPPTTELEGLRFVTVKSPALKRRADVTLWESKDAAPGSGPLAILLHGVYGSHWAWAFKGGAHRTARRLIESNSIRPIALAMPSDGLWGDGSGYLPHADADYERWIVEEVPAIAAKVLRSVGQVSSIYISGLSMGGYGALRLGARYPERFKGVSAHSSVTDIGQLEGFIEEPLPSLFHDRAQTSALENLVANAWRLPPLRFDCGVADALIEPNRELHESLIRAGIAHIYEEFTGGHEWAYWSAHLADTLRFFSQIEGRTGRQVT